MSNPFIPGTPAVLGALADIVEGNCARDDRALSARKAAQVNLFPGDTRWGVVSGGRRESLEVFALGRWHLTTTTRKAQP